MTSPTLNQICVWLDHTALSPYPGLRTAVSLQAWGYQLFINDVGDPRIAEFIKDFRENPKTTPEYGATCSQPTFKLAVLDALQSFARVACASPRAGIRGTADIACVGARPTRYRACSTTAPDGAELTHSTRT